MKPKKPKNTGYISLQIKTFTKFDPSKPEHAKLIKKMDKYPYISVSKQNGKVFCSCQGWVNDFLNKLFNQTEKRLEAKDNNYENPNALRRKIKDVNIFIDEKGIPTIIANYLVTGGILLETEEIYAITPFEVLRMMDEKEVPFEFSSFFVDNDDFASGLFIPRLELTFEWLHKMYLENGNTFRRDCLAYYTDQRNEASSVIDLRLEKILSYADEGVAPN